MLKKSHFIHSYLTHYEVIKTFSHLLQKHSFAYTPFLYLLVCTTLDYEKTLLIKKHLF